MNDLTQEINDLITKNAAAGTFTVDVIKQMNNLAEDSAKLVSSNKTLQSELKHIKETLNTCQTVNNNMQEKFREVDKREADLLLREKEMLKLELTASHHNTRVSDHVNMFNLVFRNMETRQSMFGTHATGDGYSPAVNETIETTIK